ncbi:hypothetical protein [Lacihabitans lacunae]|uniref:Initiator Rep protein domain-containing protein n=1 Tax=Lacihabitans lacunae TaxID=1028214 RepID=A0ABV7Z4A6_9BACT
MSKKQIVEIQNNEDYIILNNPLASPKFIRLIGKGKEMTINDVYTPKIFYEIASRLTPEHLLNIKRNQSIVFDISIKDFLQSIGANKKNYKHFIESVEIMQSNLLRWKEGDDIITTAIVTKSIHNPKTGKVEMFIDSDIAKRILEIKIDGNFSFLKSNVFRLQNAQAIKLYPFLKSWVNHGQYQTDLERFKFQFGYNTPGYKYWSNLEIKVLKPAIDEINEKTDINAYYETLGENLDGKRPKVRGVIFKIRKKEDIKLLVSSETNQTEGPVMNKNQTTLYEEEEKIAGIYALFLKIEIEQKPSEIAAKAHLKNLVEEIGIQATRDGILGMVDSKAKPKSMAFFTAKNLLKYPGFEKAKQEAATKKMEQQKQKEQELKNQRTIEELKRLFEEARKKFHVETYKNLESEKKQELLEKLWDNVEFKSIYFKENNITKPNSFGIQKIAELVAYPNGIDEKKHFKHFAKKNYNIGIDYNEAGEIIIKS